MLDEGGDAVDNEHTKEVDNVQINDVMMVVDNTQGC